MKKERNEYGTWFGSNRKNKLNKNGTENKSLVIVIIIIESALFMHDFFSSFFSIWFFCELFLNEFICWYRICIVSLCIPMCSSTGYWISCRYSIWKLMLEKNLNRFLLNYHCDYFIFMYNTKIHWIHCRSISDIFNSIKMEFIYSDYSNHSSDKKYNSIQMHKNRTI